MCGTECSDCDKAVTETRKVTARLGQAELRALRVLAEAGLVSPLAQNVYQLYGQELGTEILAVAEAP
jgi:hypothetical protein